MKHPQEPPLPLIYQNLSLGVILLADQRSLLWRMILMMVLRRKVVRVLTGIDSLFFLLRETMDLSTVCQSYCSTVLTWQCS